MTFEQTNPPEDGYLVSAELRDNFAALQASVGGVNLCKDPTFLIWAAGDAAAPTHWVTSGTGHAIARAGTGLGDTKRKVGKYCAKLTAGGGATAYILQNLLTTASYDDFLDGLEVSKGAWVWCASAGTARLVIDDGVTSTSSDAHSGGSGWEWLTVTHTISSSATKLAFGMSVGAGGVAYLSGVNKVLGGVPPSGYQPAPCVMSTLRFGVAGDLTGLTGTQIDTWLPGRPGLVQHVQLYSKTAPTGAAIIVDVNTIDGGAAFTSMFSTRPEIAVSNNAGGGVPDGTYARRCLAALVGVTGYPSSVGAFLTVDLDQVGSSVAGADLSIQVRVLQFASPMEAFLGITEVQ